MAQSVVVFGAGGGTGLECVRQLLANTTNAVTCVVRDPAKYKETFPNAGERVKLAPGDVTDPASVKAALQGAKGAIFAASGKGYWSADAVDHKGVANVAQAAKEAGVGRVVLVSSMLTTPKNRWHPVRILLNNMRWGLMDAKFKGEEALRASGVDYCVVRPAGLNKGPGGQADILVGQGDNGKVSGSISRADVAAVCVEALSNPGTSHTTIEIASKPAAGGAASDGWKQALASLKKDA